MDLEQLGTIAGIVLVVAGLLTAAGILAYAGLSRQTRDLWKERGDALEQRLNEVEAAQRECLAREEATKGRMESLENTNKVLSDQVSGTTAVLELGRRIEEHHRAVMEALGREIA